MKPSAAAVTVSSTAMEIDPAHTTIGQHASSTQRGELVIVGCGIQAPRHISQRTVAEIRSAEIVLALADPFALDWLSQLNPRLINLGEHYREDRDRRLSYRDMQAEIMARLHAGHRTCVVLYGHPGVFAQVGRKALVKARSEGIPGRMEPAISAADCLYADLDIDPGEHGLQSIECTQFLIQQRSLDPTGLLVLWQLAHTGKLDCTGFAPDRRALKLLVAKLERWYRPDHQVILYEAASLPIIEPRMESLPLRRLAAATINEITTLVIPPAQSPVPDQAMIDQLRATFPPGEWQETPYPDYS